jgi:hypothetical protein
LEGGILASLDVTISIDVHFLENVQNVSNTAVIVFNVRQNVFDSVVLAIWGSGEVALNIAVVKGREDKEEDVASIRDSGENEVGVEGREEVGDAKVPLGARAISIIGGGVVFLVTFGLGVIIILTVVGDELFAGAGKGVSSNNSTKGNNHKKSRCLNSGVPGDGGVEADGLGGGSGNSSINLVPDVTSSDKSKDDDEKRPELPGKDNDDFESVNEVAQCGSTSIGVVETSGKANACINRFDNNVGSGGQDHG